MAGDAHAAGLTCRIPLRDRSKTRRADRAAGFTLNPVRSYAGESLLNGGSVVQRRRFAQSSIAIE
ncbi:hypothetical protein C9I56_28505 [Paraburkholderia caribensis]|uniref:Uncharacterized protein n=1 Tax=Paraburkholderia caribensis TaxID=75105 RepID=A0A9Q6S0G3_9BURK|nr:hypothetical protein ATN79_14215 [Paraburkholderia caribensis]PTB25385.1 hypothetical protein C9I56_28505 [Paraburkholderia caribensis]QLB62872.1 hypothetical protein A9O66_11050 [Paraburkholderia caribensis]CAG9212798.1 conserved hypothetical protein [Paraburkholderia caribensis]